MGLLRRNKMKDKKETAQEVRTQEQLKENKMKNLKFSDFKDMTFSDLKKQNATW